MIKLVLMLGFIYPLFLCCSPDQREVILIPMRDGTKLSTQILFPQEKQEKYPVVLLRTPYNREGRVQEYAYLLTKGYVLVLQDVRGRFASEGLFEPFINEREDGYDTVEWIAKQVWCDGNIGMIGASYNGLVQYSAAVEQPPHLKTIIPNVAMADPFHNAYINGIFTPNSLIWCAIIEGIGTDEEIYGKDWEKLLDHLPASDLDSIVTSKKLGYYQRWVAHDFKDSYWKLGSHFEKIKGIKIPVFIQTGWFDSQLQSSKLAYNALKEAGNPNLKLIIGPWGHTDEESKFYEGASMGEAADDVDLQAQYISWLDYWLKGEENGIMKEPLVQLYAMNSNKWYEDNTFPLGSSTNRKLFLSSAQSADLQTKGGSLSFDADHKNESIDTYLYDPAQVPVFTEEMFDRKTFDLYRKMLEGRKDYLFYKTVPFGSKCTLLGQITARIYASSSAPDTDWFTILVLLDEEDKIVELISLGALRARFRNSFENPVLLEEDKVYPFELDMNPYGIQINKGQKLGLFITSSWGYPLLGKNLNTGKNNQLETEYQLAEQKVYHTKEYPSYISIPIINEQASVK